MIDLTPLDVPNKRGDFKKIIRGYDPHEVDVFLELATERLEALVRENLQLRERAQVLQDQVNAQVSREQVVQDALVMAQELRVDIREQCQRDADHALTAAEAEARRILAEASPAEADYTIHTEESVDEQTVDISGLGPASEQIDSLTN